MTRLIQEAVVYGIASVCALRLDVAVLWALVGCSGWGYLPGATASFLTGRMVAYQFSVRFGFEERPIRERRREFVGFIAIGTLGMAVNAAGLTFACNFIARRQLLFVRPSTA